MDVELRDYFAAHCQVDDRLVKCVRAMDDTALLMFATNPEIERDEWITETGMLCGSNVFAGKEEVEKVVIRLTLEAKAIARVRGMQADAMLAERERGVPLSEAIENLICEKDALLESLAALKRERELAVTSK